MQKPAEKEGKITKNNVIKRKQCQADRFKPNCINNYINSK